MQLSNRTLALFALFTAMLAGTALWLEYGSRPPVAQTTEAAPPRPLLPDVSREGGREVAPAGPLRVRLRSGRSASATLSCDGVFRSQRPFERGSVAFPTIPLGQCHLRLQGADIPYEPVFPGDRLSCWNEDTTTQCRGGLAATYTARVSIDGAEPGTVFVDGEDLGPLPVEGHSVRVGKRLIIVQFEDGTMATWTLTVSPDETITMHFPSRSADLVISDGLRRNNDSDSGDETAD